MRIFALLLIVSLPILAACEDPYPPTPKPDLTIRVEPTPQGLTAVPPECLSWPSATIDPFDNQSLPQHGCASARNLALMAENPNDLVKGREMGSANGVTINGAMVRYNNNQTRALIWTGTDPNDIAKTTASTSTSTLTGEVLKPSAGAASSSSPSSSGPTNQ